MIRDANFNVIPLMGDRVECRDITERLDEEIYRTIPALTKFAKAAMDVGNKLSVEARNALFFDKGSDPELRALKIENALVKLHDQDSVQPDLEWLQGVAPPVRRDFESPDNDFWVGQAGPK